MPLYEYQCEACGQRFEVIQKFSDPPTDTCRKCGKGPVQRLMSSPAIQFKGSGWYITDYAQKGKSDSGSSSSSKKADKDAPAGEAKSDAKSESKSEPAKSESPKTDSAAPKTSGSS